MMMFPNLSYCSARALPLVISVSLVVDKRVSKFEFIGFTFYFEALLFDVDLLTLLQADVLF